MTTKSIEKETIENAIDALVDMEDAGLGNSTIAKALDYLRYMNY